MMNHNKVPAESVERAYLIQVQYKPITPLPGQTVVPGASTAQSMSVQIVKYGPENVMTYPSLADYLRDTFNLFDASENDSIGVMRASNKIASNSRRGTGNYLLINPNSTFNLGSIPTTITSMTIEHADWLDEDEVFLCWSNRATDSGFVWNENGDGTVNVSAVPNVKDYGYFIKKAS